MRNFSAWLHLHLFESAAFVALIAGAAVRGVLLRIALRTQVVVGECIQQVDERDIAAATTTTAGDDIVPNIVVVGSGGDMDEMRVFTE